MARFPHNFIDDLKTQADIVKVVQDTVPLKKAGNNYKGLCPFHSERTPSFHVNPEKGFFHCFGCAAGGDVIKFVELTDNLSFPEAVQSLAQRFGLEVPPSDDREHDEVMELERETLLKLHEWAESFFQEQLTGSLGAQARQYLEKRTLTKQTTETLRLGFAPPHRESLKQHLLNAGYPLDILLRSGLVVQREGGKVVDRFRNRLMIPIYRDTGSVVAFGGRALASEQQPKYVNSPETLLFSKGRTLYGLHLTKKAIRRLGYAVMVEGYFDFAQAYQSGVQPIVAICGTALTESQARLLHRCTTKVILSFDPDFAGQNASERSGELLISEGLQVNVALLPPGEDPDTCIRKRSAVYFSDKLKHSQPFLEYALEHAARDRDFSRDQPRRSFLTEMLKLAARIPDAAARDQFADRLAHKAHIMEDVVRVELRKAAVERRTNVTTKLRGATSVISTAERGLIWATLRKTSAAQAVLKQMENADFQNLPTAPILQLAKILSDLPTNIIATTLVERLTADEASLVSSIGNETTAPASASDCAIELKRLRYERERAELQDEINRRQKDGTPSALAEIDTLWQKKITLLQRIENLLD